MTPPPSFLRCARSPPPAPAPSLVRRRSPKRPVSAQRSGRGALQAEPRAVAPRGDSMGAHQPALGLLLLLLCFAQVSGFQRPGRAGRDAAGRCGGSGDPGAGAAGVGKLVFRCSCGGRFLLLCQSTLTLSCALGEGDSWGLYVTSFELFQRWSPDLGCGIGGTMGAEDRDFGCR